MDEDDDSDLIDHSESSDSSEGDSGSELDSDSDDEESYKSQSDNEDGKQDEVMEVEFTEETLEVKIKTCKDAIKASRERQNEARVRKKEASDALSSLGKTIIKVQKEKNAFCSLKRSEVHLQFYILLFLN